MTDLKRLQLNSTRQFILVIVLLFQISSLNAQKRFSFVFLPDLHLQPDKEVIADFEELASHLNRLRPDFVLTGGDMIYTAKNVDDKKAEVLFDLMDKELKLLKMPVYMTMGNHENVGITAESGIDKSNPNWGKQMFEKRYHPRFYSFNFNGWKFFVLDGIKILEREKNYTSGIDSLQIEWIKQELSSTGPEMPLVISVHTPFINPHAMTRSGLDALSEASANVLSLFKDHNLKMVLQGHNHTYMNLYINGIHYISGGSSSFGTNLHNDGFLHIKIKKDTEKIEFIKGN